MKNKLFIYLTFIMAVLLLAGCGGGNNIQLQFTNGACANGETGAPYCMAVILQNNESGQNWISSTNFPLSSLNISVTGAGNILTPANTSGLDPNGCFNSNITPGNNCTFYLQMAQESYPVTGVEPININLTYTINNALFGSSTNTGSSQATIYEFTNLYIVQNNGTLWQYNGSFGGALIESNDTNINSVAADNGVYGFLYLGGNLGIYQFGIESISTKVTASIAGANNLFTAGFSTTNLYAMLGPLGTGGLNSSSFSSPSSWSLVGSLSLANTNANTYYNGVAYLAQTNQVKSCFIESAGICSNEGLFITTGGTINSLGYVQPIVSPTVTGLYAGANGGLFFESGTLGNSASTWLLVTESLSGESLIQPINTITSDINGNLYAGDSSGNIWIVNNNNPTVASQFTSVSGSITNMIVDNFGSVLYFVAYNGTNSTIYSCPITSPIAIVNSCATESQTVINSQQTMGLSKVAGMAIGSEINSATSIPILGTQ